MMENNVSIALKNWIPIKLLEEPNNDLCRWLYVGKEKFSAPFFDETISACKSLPENSHLKRSISSVGLLPTWAKGVESISPTAFIFHISRCGSTLVSQLLDVPKNHLTLSEVPFFDELLRHGLKNNCMDSSLEQLKASIAFYASKRDETYQKLFVKTDSWHIHFYNELRTLYPNTPFFFLYRKPDEVLFSQQKKRGMQAIPNLLEAAIFGFEKDVIAYKSLDEYMGMVMEGYLQKYYEILQKDKNCYPINYHNGIMELIDTIATIASININEEDKLAMQKRAGFHAKYPEQVFKAEKEENAIPIYLQKSFDLYDKIEEIRLNKL